MKQIFLQVAFVVLATSSLYAQTQTEKKPGNDIVLNNKYKKADSLHALMKRYTDAGLPGVSLAIYSEESGWWAGAEGYANVEDKTPMTVNNLQYLQSIAKTYMAVAILKLYEQNKIDLDASITKYLPAKYSRYVKDAVKVTVRMLLNHTSGIAEYSNDPAFVSYLLQHPLQQFSVEDVLKTIKDKELMFASGSKHRYSNTNYELLALIADAITGDHAAFIAKNIFEPLKLEHTFYRNDPGYLHYPQLVDCYWDVLNTGNPANITAMQRVNVASFIGDDGIVCTTTDAIKFLKGLLEGKLLSPATLAQMETWVNDDEGNPIYGLGLEHYSAGGVEAYGHSGGGIGAGCILVYIPLAKTYVFMATNIGTLFAGTLPAKANQLKDEILGTILQ